MTNLKWQGKVCLGRTCWSLASQIPYLSGLVWGIVQQKIKETIASGSEKPKFTKEYPMSEPRESESLGSESTVSRLTENRPVGSKSQGPTAKCQQKVHDEGPTMEDQGSLGAEDGTIRLTDPIRSAGPPEAAGGPEPTNYESMKEIEY